MNYKAVVNLTLQHLDREIEQKKKRIEHLQKQYRTGSKVESDLAYEALESVLGEWEQANLTKKAILDALTEHETGPEMRDRLNAYNLKEVITC